MSDKGNCTYEGCVKPAKTRAPHLCDHHRKKQYRSVKSAGNPRLFWKQFPHCTFPGCVNKKHSKGLCASHIKQDNRGEELSPVLKEKEYYTAVDGYKTCTECHENKSVDEFQRSSKNNDGLKYQCRQCQADISRRTNLWNNYRMTVEKYEEMYSEQGGRCFICREKEQGAYYKTGKVKRLAVDHDHDCCPGNKSCGDCIRGLLCHKCNLGIGNFRDNEDLLAAAALYLELHKEGNGN